MHTASPRGGIVRAARRPAGWVAPGPAPRMPEDPGELWPGPHEDLCWLAGNWRILQRTDGHRFSLDDLVTAHMAATEMAERPPAHLLDLGCGIGSVLLFLAWRFPGARCLGIEAQEVSAKMARRSVTWNGAQERCEVRLGDFREPESTAGLGAFDLVTGTPPYFPRGTGLESENVQRGPCRFELRGGIEAYCATATRLLAPGAPFVVCEAHIQQGRVDAAAASAGLRVVRSREVIPRAGKAPLFSVYVLRRNDEPCGERIIDPPLVVRDAQGRRTVAFAQVRDAMGMP